MLIGHAGIAELLKASRRDVRFRWLVLAAYLPDLVRLLATPLVSAFHAEIFSHSVIAVVILALAVGVISKARGATTSGAAAIALACLTHWPADVFTGCKPVFPGVPWVGFFGYRHPIADVAVEGFLFVCGWMLLMRGNNTLSRTTRRAIPVICLGLQLSFLTGMYVNQEFFIGRTEWLWYPGQSLVPKQRPLEHLGCHRIVGD